MKKIKLFSILATSILTTSFTIPFVVSCSKSSTNKNSNNGPLSVFDKWLSKDSTTKVRSLEQANQIMNNKWNQLINKYGIEEMVLKAWDYFVMLYSYQYNLKVTTISNNEVYLDEDFTLGDGEGGQDLTKWYDWADDDSYPLQRNFYYNRNSIIKKKRLRKL